MTKQGPQARSSNSCECVLPFAGVDLARMSRARHALYMVISQTLVQANARYHLPSYENMEVHMMSHALRPPGEGSSFMPSYLRKGGLKL